ncbi:MAG TPA: TIGR03435 family protein [Candidatus Sulfotelmatobacter sp.]|jgi:uncharacterized protein (TIGR03435 family)|nr:TIGR03435 family protein [Candidatus Sulfotelmatobacter sp.]
MCPKFWVEALIRVPKILFASLLLMSANGLLGNAVAANRPPVFAVGTIRPSKQGARGNSFRVKGNRFEATNASLNDLISFAYDLHAKQIANDRDWGWADKFDVAAQADSENQPTEQQWREMIQKLLSESFKLRLHRTRKELSVYVLSVAEDGARLKRSKGDPNGLPQVSLEAGAIAAANASMADLAEAMQRAVVDRPVIDQTGIKGRYDFSLGWTSDNSQFGTNAAKNPSATDTHLPPALPAAIREQIGLRLDATTAPLDVLVVDQVERPYENSEEQK